MPSPSLSRRRFIESSAAGAAALSMGTAAFAGDEAAIAPAEIEAATSSGVPRPQIRNFQEGISYRRFAETDIHLSVLGLGSVTCVERAIRRGVERGINLIHTSLDYEGGRAIRDIGRLMKTHRDRVYLALKDIFTHIDDALSLLNTDHVDFIFFNRHTPESAADPSIREKFERWKDQGKVRFCGLTTHGRVQPTIRAGIESGMYDIVMPTFNPQSQQELEAELQLAEQKGIQVFSMKTMGGVDEARFGDRLREALAVPAVLSVVKGIPNFEVLDGLIEAQRPERLGMAPAKRAPQRVASCAMCGRCEAACPMGLALPEMIRCSAYYMDEQHAADHARRTFAAIPRERTARACLDCGSCENACPWGIDARYHIHRATAMFG